MKIYCFYLIKDKIDISEYPAIYKENIITTDNKDITLYAFTPEKESELYFLKTRDMNKFFEKIIEIDREDYQEFCDINKDQLLEYHTFNTKSISNDKYISKMIYILCTTAESDCILYYKEAFVLNIISDILNDNVLEMLEKVKFKKKINKVLNDTFLLSEIVSKVTPLEDINYDVFTIDELSLYIKLFSNTLKK